MASYPTSAKSWTPLVDNVDQAQAAQVNSIYDEVTAIETDLLAGVQKTLLNAAPAADGYSGQVISLTATAETHLGDVGFIASTGKVTEGDADAIATAGVVVMATATIAADAAGIWLLDGTIHLHSKAPGWTIGGLVYLSTDAGAMTQVAPSGANDVIQILGVALAADILLFKPSLVMVEHA